MSGVPRLRVGLMLDSLVVPRWVSAIIAQLEEAPFVDVAVVVTDRRRWRDLRSPGPLRESVRRMAFRLYEKADHQLFRSANDAFAPTDVSDRLGAVQVLGVTPRRSREAGTTLDETALEALDGCALDVLLAFGFRDLAGRATSIPRYGIWDVHHGDDRSFRGGPPLFWEMYDRSPVSGTTLRILSGTPGEGRAIYRSYSATDQVSLNRSRDAAYWKTASFVMRRLTDLHRMGWDYIRSRPTYLEESASPKPAHRIPTLPQLAWHVLRIAAGVAGRRAHKLLYREQWFVAYRPRRAETTRLEEGLPFQVLLPPRRRDFADPFVLEHDGATYLFFEDYAGPHGKGVIQYVVLDDEGRPSAPRLALERDYHVSYPFVFEHEGDVYMVPETSSVRRVELYRAVGFPDRWERVKVLLEDIEAVDPTLLAHDGRFWLFTSVAERGATTVDELFLFHADSLTGDWTTHPANPVVSDVRVARPAGRIRVRDGTLIRPGQDCSQRYGHAISLNQIEVLTRTDYRERQIGRIAPDWMEGNLATHSYDFTERFEVVDGAAPRAKFPLFDRSPGERTSDPAWAAWSPVAAQVLLALL